MELSIEKLVFGGQGLAKKDGRTYLVWNALPGETVDARIVKKTSAVYESATDKVLAASPDRLEAAEPHYLCCSPWQILAFDAENAWKQKIAAETYARLGGLKDLGLPPIVSDAAAQMGYRNKMEYVFSGSASGLSLAFFERDTHTKVPVEPCRLADDTIGRACLRILEWLKKDGPHPRALKSLIVRCDGRGHAIAGLCLNEPLGIRSHPALDSALSGFHITCDEKVLLSVGAKDLTAVINGVPLKFGLLSFFQINVPLFEKALEEMSSYLDPSARLVDYYSGVGAIGISLKGRYSHAALVESHPQACAYAKENIKANGLTNCEAIQSDSERMTRLVQKDATLVFDPPRAGLDSKLVRKVLAEKPARLVYLSCNIATHARDLKLLLPEYTLKALTLYNFFPRTPHIESLAVLDRK